MKCLAKYLPVEGASKEGDLITTPKGTYNWGRYIKDSHTIIIDDSKLGQTSTKTIVHRLFAVTQDIPDGIKTVDDWIKEIHIEHKDRSSEKTVEVALMNTEYALEEKKLGEVLVELNITNWFKVLGELSPNATWVKEGDEIEVVLNQEIDIDSKHMGLVDKVIDIHVLGPCGHYH